MSAIITLAPSCGRSPTRRGGAVASVVTGPEQPDSCEELLPAAWHHTEQSDNNWAAADHGRLSMTSSPGQEHALRSAIRTRRRP
jgi:hypothetical protein